MTNQEFSDMFDVVAQSYKMAIPFGMQDPTAFDEYEKSVFLTQAQEKIVIDIYSGNSSMYFEQSEEARRYLRQLIKTVTLQIPEDGSEIEADDSTGYFIDKDAEENMSLKSQQLDDRSLFFKLPEDVWFITYESVCLKKEDRPCDGIKEIIVKPATQDDFHNVMENPFKRPSKRRAIRLDVGGNISEIVTELGISAYKLRYVKKPRPIILVDLENEGISINNKNKQSECELDSILHTHILDMAVKNALISRGLMPQAQPMQQ